MDKVRLWRIDPTKHFQSEVHNLMVVIERANETNNNSMPDKNILAIFFEEISLLLPLDYALQIKSASWDLSSII